MCVSVPVCVCVRVCFPPNTNFLSTRYPEFRYRVPQTSQQPSHILTLTLGTYTLVSETWTQHLLVQDHCFNLHRAAGEPVDNLDAVGGP